jgi:aryl-alcohol dehydrogenase-like predicted oxidoreductase
MERRRLGTTDLEVSVVGLGAGRIGGPETSDAEVDRLVGAALDAGVTLIDTARSYGQSEERLGRALAGRRDRVVLSTKVGYGVPGIADWTPEVIGAGVDAALGRLRTDRLDLVHLHSCDRGTLERSGVVEALRKTVEAGKVRVAAYSGEGEALLWAIRSAAFGAVQCSVSVVDQGVLGGTLAEARSRGLGVIAKRSLGNAPWRFSERPAEDDVAEAWDRFRALGLDESGLRPSASGPGGFGDLFTRFAAFAPGVSAVLVGTSRPQHLLDAVESVARGPLEKLRLEGLAAGWQRFGQSWRGRI